MAAEDVGSTSGLAHIAQGQLQDARGTHHGIAGGVLGLSHAPHNGARVVVVQHLGHTQHLLFFDAAGFFDGLGLPLGQDFLLDLLHAKHAVVDVLLVFPAVLEDVIQQAKQEGDVSARADAHKLVGSRRRARETGIHHDHLAAVFLGMQHVQHGDGMGLGGIGADVHRDLAVLHVVVRIGHGPIAPGIGHTGHRGGVTNTGLVVTVVGAPVADKLAQQIGLLVVVFGRADEVHAVRARRFAQLEHLCADFSQRGVPADALVLAIHQFHRVTQSVLAVPVLAQGRPFGAMGAQVDG